jgi:hypothetical protein
MSIVGEFPVNLVWLRPSLGWIPTLIGVYQLRQ